MMTTIPVVPASRTVPAVQGVQGVQGSQGSPGGPGQGTIATPGTSGAPVVLRAALLLASLASLAPADALRAQVTVSGTVLEAEARTPLAGILVRIETTGSVTTTRQDGAFELPGVPEGAHAFSFGGLTYRDTTLVVDVSDADPLEILLTIEPLELEGIRITGRSFETRSLEVHRTLDARLARLLGRSRVAIAQDARGHYGGRNAWSFLEEALGVHPTMRDDHVRVSGRVVRPVVFIDDERAWLYQLVEGPIDPFCRVEYHEPRPGLLRNVAPQLRAYTCSFLGRVAAGMETLDETVDIGGGRG